MAGPGRHKLSADAHCMGAEIPLARQQQQASAGWHCKKAALAHIFKTLSKQRRLGACNLGLLQRGASKSH